MPHINRQKVQSIDAMHFGNGKSKDKEVRRLKKVSQPKKKNLKEISLSSIKKGMLSLLDRVTID